MLSMSCLRRWLRRHFHLSRSVRTRAAIRSAARAAPRSRQVADGSQRGRQMPARLAAAFAMGVALNACAISPGPEVPQALMCDIPRSYLEVEAHDGDDPNEAVSVATGNSFADALRAVYNSPSPSAATGDEPVSPSMLFMSGGSQHGAFGAGFLEGWAADRPGHLPRFLVVTGISTGSIMATHAFLDRTDTIASNYRITRESQVLRPLVRADASQLSTVATVLRHGAVGDLAPMRGMLSASITPDVLLAVADEATFAGRKLYVGAVDIDLGRAVIFDMTALAQKYAHASPAQRPRLRDCYLDAIVASSSVPGAALPQFIDNRMYIDGGARFGVISDEIGKVVEQQWLASSTSPVAAGATPPLGPNVFTIINGKLAVEPRCGKAQPAQCSAAYPDSPIGAHADWKVPDLASRSLSVLINQVYRFSNDRIVANAKARGLEPYVERIRSDVKDFPARISHPAAGPEAKTCSEWEAEDTRLERPLEFHPRYMHCLVAYGASRAHRKLWACAEPIDLRTPAIEVERWEKLCERKWKQNREGS